MDGPELETTVDTETEGMNRGDLGLLEQACAGFNRLKAEIGKVIIGQQTVVEPLLAAVFSQGHSLIIGVPGLAKTLLVRTLSDVLGWRYKRIQFTPDMMPADIIGMELLQQDSESGRRSMEFVPGPLFAQMILADEINRTPPKTQAALLQAMEELQVTVGGKTYQLPRPFFVLATQNPIEQEGTYPLPEAQLDRFMFDIRITYPTPEDELQIAKTTTANVKIDVSKVLAGDEIIKLQEIVRCLPISVRPNGTEPGRSWFEKRRRLASPRLTSRSSE